MDTVPVSGADDVSGSGSAVGEQWVPVLEKLPFRSVQEISSAGDGSAGALEESPED